ncbi:DUF4139 domain-containing protein [Kiritimatiella glycovorans]|uniref:DUF4139 domain-containing protein n=1 Tax=Kiritimatiella glycovorans TaxID=1307763 RepID=A0A0G3ELD8_9BACT|nr:DUF4139 domain-containing protein [Kiritimatiella glycovorans]AKJ65585.1 hypothetical protein L21SP4_02359 [Kiritimatiella glycovorans]
MNRWIMTRGWMFAAAGVTAAAAAPETAITVYSDDYAAVREVRSLHLDRGLNEDVLTGDLPRGVETGSVLLSPLEPERFEVHGMVFRPAARNGNDLLPHFVGEQLEFEQRFSEGVRTVKGRLVRAGAEGEPVVETDNRYRFGLPGTPLFPPAPSDGLLRPAMRWTLHAAKSGAAEAELAYLTRGMSWSALYRFESAEDSERGDFSGWVLVRNQTGSRFEDAQVRLLAGEVHRSADRETRGRRTERVGFSLARAAAAAPKVEERSVDEYHLYRIDTPLTLEEDTERRVPWIRAASVGAKRRYVYEGPGAGHRYYVHNNESFGTEAPEQVGVVREILNEESNGLGIPLPTGRVQFYRRDAGDAAPVLVGENTIPHIPQGETMRLYTGRAFDLVGERKRTGFDLDSRARRLDETYVITLRNRKETPVTIRIREHLVRWPDAEILSASHEHRRPEDRLLLFDVSVKPDEEKTVTYTVRYTW